MSIKDEKDVKTSFPKRLRIATDSWRRIKKIPLQHRKSMLTAWAAGYFEGDATAKTAHPMNLIDRAIGIIVPYLVMNNPKAMITTKFSEHRHFAYTTQLAVNHLLEEIKFAMLTLRPAVLHSMFGTGIVKTGIMKKWEVELFGYLHDVGQVYTNIVDESNFIGDPSSTNIEDSEFLGDEYLMPTEYAKDFFGERHADHIRPSFQLYGHGHPDEISHDSKQNDTNRFLKEFTRFRDYWIPDENIVLTMTSDDSYNKILREVDYDGPENGPYDVLAYKYFPETSIPIPPAWGWMDFDSMINVIINKARKQAENEKKVLAYESEAAGDAERIAGTPDRGTVKVDNLQALKEIEFPGINPESYTWLQYIESQFSSQGGNLHTIGGRNVQAETLGQEQMLMSNASKLVDDMLGMVYSFATSIYRKVSWYMWTDPLIHIPVIKKIPGYGEIEKSFNQVDKDGEFYDFTFNIQPYSMQRQSPDQDFQKMMLFLTQWVLPTTQLAAQQGAMINIPEATRVLAQKFNIDDIDSWYEQAMPQNADLNPYSPEQKKDKPGQTGPMGANSRQANQMQATAAGGGMSSVDSNKVRKSGK